MYNGSGTERKSGESDSGTLLSLSLDKLADSGHQHLDGERHEKHSHEPFDGDEHPFSETLRERARHQDDESREEPGEDECGKPLRPSLRLLIHDEENRSQRRRAGDVRNREGNDEGLAGELLPHGRPRPREHHSYRDEEQDRSSRRPERGLRDVEGPQDVLSREKEYHQDDERDYQLPHDDAPVSLPRHILEGGDEERDVPERVEDQEEENRRGEESHGSSVHGKRRDLRTLTLDADDLIRGAPRPQGD